MLAEPREEGMVLATVPLYNLFCIDGIDSQFIHIGGYFCLVSKALHHLTQLTSSPLLV